LFDNKDLHFIQICHISETFSWTEAGKNNASNSDEAQ